MPATSTEPGRTIERMLRESRPRCGVATLVLYWRVEGSRKLLPIAIDSEPPSAALEAFLEHGDFIERRWRRPQSRPRSRNDAYLTVPIRLGDEAVGFLAAYSDSGARPGCGGILASLARQFASMSAALTGYCAVRVRRMTFELGVSGAIDVVAVGNVEDLLMRADSLARVILGADVLGIIVPREGKTLVRRVARSLAGRTIAEHSCEEYADRDSLEPSEAVQMLGHDAKLSDVAVIPLVPGHGRGGFLVVGWTSARPSIPALDMMMAAIARHIAPTVGIGRLRDALHGHRRRLDNAKRRIGVLSRIGRELGATLDESSIYKSVARVAVPEIGDYCLLHLVERGAKCRLVAASGLDEANTESLKRHFAQQMPTAFSEDGWPSIVTSPKAEVVWDIEKAAAESTLPGDATLAFLAVGARASVSVPIRNEERNTAILTVIFTTTALERTDVDLIEQLARRVGIALVNARQYAREYRISHVLQRALLPKMPGAIGGMPVSAAYLPADRDGDIGGDWYDVFPLPNGRFGVSVGDVAGHGIDATTVMNVARHAIRVAALTESSPATVLSRVDRMFQMEANPPFMTAIFGIMQPSFRRFEYATAGHPPPIVARADGDVATLKTSGPPIGVALDADFTTSRIDLSLGDTLVLYSDGMIEYNRDVVAGERALQEAVRDAVRRDDPDRALVIQSIVFGEKAPKDDAIVLVIGCGLQHHSQIKLSAVPQSCRTARVLVRNFLQDHGVEKERASDIITAAGEAVTNAVEHAYADSEPRDFTLSLDAEDGRVSLVIRDSGRWREGSRLDRGRGIVLMHAMMDDVQIETTAAGTEVRLVKERSLVPV